MSLLGSLCITALCLLFMQARYSTADTDNDAVSVFLQDLRESRSSNIPSQLQDALNELYEWKKNMTLRVNEMKAAGFQRQDQLKTVQQDNYFIKRDIKNLKTTDKDLKEENRLLKVQLQQLNSTHAQLENKDAILENEIKQLVKEVSGLKQENNQLRKDVDILNSTAAKLEKENENLKKDVQGLKATDTQLKEDGLHLKGNIQSLNETGHQLANLTEQLKSGIQDLSTADKRIEAKTLELTIDFKGINASYDKLEEKYHQLTNGIQGFNATEIKLTEDFRQLSIAVQNLNASCTCNTLTNEGGHKVNNVSSLERAIWTLQINEVQTKREISSLEINIQNLTGTSFALQKEGQNMKSDIIKLKKDVANLKPAQVIIEDDLKSLRKNVSTLQGQMSNEHRILTQIGVEYLLLKLSNNALNMTTTKLETDTLKLKNDIQALTATGMKLTLENKGLKAQIQDLNSTDTQLLKHGQAIKAKIAQLNDTDAQMQKDYQRTETDVKQIQDDIIALKKQHQTSLATSTAFKSNLTHLYNGLVREDRHMRQDINDLSAINLEMKKDFRNLVTDLIACNACHAERCQTSPCKNNGSCTDKITGYVCTCPTGFTGKQCETNIDDCLSAPTNSCGSHGTCVDGINNFTCSCDSGFYGQRCEFKVDACASNPCGNHSTCVDSSDGYTCVCASGFTGKSCNVNIDGCLSNPCLHGKCKNGVPGTFDCTCEPGYTGKLCDQALRRNCHDLLKYHNVTKDGAYSIQPSGFSSFVVWCDMTTDGGGWTVFQKRFNGSVDFYRNWMNYTDGFGDVDGGEFWLGLDKIHALTSAGSTSLRINLGDWEGNGAHAFYKKFWIDNSTNKYELHFGGYDFNGLADDAFGLGGRYGPFSHFDAKFSTFDQDNDNSLGKDCAKLLHSGFWFNGCGSSNLNGKYYMGGQYQAPKIDGVVFGDGVEWWPWKWDRYSLKTTVMMIRPDDTGTTPVPLVAPFPVGKK